MPIETFWKLMNLAQNGATIIFYKGLPTDVPGLANVKENQKKMNVLKEKLSFTKSNAVSVADYGKGRIIVSDNVAELLDNSQIVSESMYDAGLQCIRRVKDDGNFYYYILNPTSKEYKGWICLNGDYTSAALYNPMSGVNGYAEIRENSEKMEVYIHFKPNEAFIVETYKDKYSGELYPFYEQKGEAVAITDNWQIEFVKGGPTLPPTKTVETLESWTNYGTEYAVFSGTAVYTTRIPALAGKSDAWLLDLGKVNESAAVYLNDEYLGTIINSPYTIEIPSDKLKGDDKLSIKVSNLMANRIADMDKKDIEWRIFYNTNFAARRKENTGEDGKFSAKKWAPIHSGLSGPVALKPLEKFR